LKIECQKCKAQYTFNEKGLKYQAVKVRCPKCFHYILIRSGNPLPDNGGNISSDQIFLSKLQEQINGLLLRIKEKDKEIERLKDILKKKDNELDKKENQLMYKDEQIIKLQHMQERGRGFLSGVFSRKNKKKKEIRKNKDLESLRVERID
jgi:predicted Zn finger-like uncharacterized protein